VNLETTKNYLIDLIFPRKCLGCGQFMENCDNSFVCKECLEAIPTKSDFSCAFCLSPVVMGKTCPFCSKEHFLDRLFVATSYDKDLVKNMVKTIKYKFIEGPVGDAAKFMLNYFQKKIAINFTINNPAVIVPVPLHKKRYNWRGFNQSEIMAEKLANGLNLPILAGVLTRKTNNRPQVEISEKEKRIDNIRGVFKCRQPGLTLSNNRDAVSAQRYLTGLIADKIVILIDDVCTTSSTLDECARVLKLAGAKEVIGFVFARGDMKSN
jgi:competence protein ComFC